MNGKLFLPPPQDGSDFKELFKRLAAAGAGRPLGSDGFPAGPWTPELLAEAISQIEPNGIGVDLRTVQLWFQENDKGISAANIRWLARVCGCDDPGATSQWQMELSAAQSKLTAKRRESKSAGGAVGSGPELSETESVENQSGHSLEPDIDARGAGRRFGLAQKSEALFSRGSPLNLPASVFAGFTALGFLSYILGIHSVTYARADGVHKQVGFLWTANWTFVFMVFLPLFIALVAQLVTFWKEEGRVALLPQVDRLESDDGWVRNVESSAYSYWAVFLICVLFAGLFQWIGVCLVPLLEGGGNYAIDWGKIAIVRPEVISVPVAIVFTGFAYLYMCLCFYLFFAGLILLYTVAYDFWKIRRDARDRSEAVEQHDAFRKISYRVMHAIFRCTILGLLIAIAMKVQSAYLVSRGENIFAWLVGEHQIVWGLDSLRSAIRVRLGSPNMLKPDMPSSSSSLPTSTGSVLQLKIRLLGLSPMVWRRVLVPETYSLRELHGVIQVTMGWESLHLFEFRIRAVRYGSSDICPEPPDKTLESFAFRKNARFAYVYDMGDWWEHEIRVEGREAAKERGRYPACIGGAGACPPEDCGGPDRYLERRDDALGLDTMDDLATMAEFVEQVVLNGDRAMLDDEDTRHAVQRAIDRSRAREPFIACRFSRRDVNKSFHQDEHRRLMHQWFT